MATQPPNSMLDQAGDLWWQDGPHYTISKTASGYLYLASETLAHLGPVSGEPPQGIRCPTTPISVTIVAQLGGSMGSRVKATIGPVDDSINRLSKQTTSTLY